MTRSSPEPKPLWSDVPPAVRSETERRLGSRVVRARRAFGGYAASATFHLTLASGRRAFFKGGYPPPPGSAAIFPIEREERSYVQLAPIARRYMPKLYGSFRVGGWHVLLMEDLGRATIPPWTVPVTEAAASAYARFHRMTLGSPLPRWLSRTQHAEFGIYWARLVDGRGLAKVASLAGDRAPAARRWLKAAAPLLVERERWLVRARRPFALLHFDTRSDNIRLRGRRLVMFDWPFASAGPAEFDTVAFAQAVAAEGGPAPERVMEWYEGVLPLRAREVDGSIAGIAGYFADRAPRAPMPGLPRIRSIQRRQLKATLGWAARRFELPDAGWIASVPD